MNWLKRNRTRAGLSQEELASRLQIQGFDISRATVGHWEQDKYRPPLENPMFCKALADVLKMSVPALLESAGFDMSFKHSEEAERVAYLIDKLPKDKRELAVRLVEQLIET